jgi:prevent-host-death family protein
MSRQVTLSEAKAKFSQLVEDAARGEEIVIAKNGKPLVKLVAAVPVDAAAPPAPKGKRKLGQLKGKVWLAPDFDAYDAEIEKLFYGGDLNDPPAEFKRK